MKLNASESYFGQAGTHKRILKSSWIQGCHRPCITITWGSKGQWGFLTQHQKDPAPETACVVTSCYLLGIWKQYATILGSLWADVSILNSSTGTTAILVCLRKYSLTCFNQADAPLTCLCISSKCWFAEMDKPFLLQLIQKGNTYPATWGEFCMEFFKAFHAVVSGSVTLPCEQPHREPALNGKHCQINSVMLWMVLQATHIIELN